MVTTAGIVLAGGRSTRMGRPKATLDWHGTSLLRRVLEAVAEGVGPVVVVRAPGQRLPALPSDVRVVQDARPERGPVEGLLAGLVAAREIAEIAFVSAVDAPFLEPAFARALIVACAEADAEAAVPLVDGRVHPLAAAYRTDLAARIAVLMEAGVDSLIGLLDAFDVRRVDRAALLRDAGLAAADPGLQSLRNLNEPDEYERARSERPPA